MTKSLSEANNKSNQSQEEPKDIIESIVRGIKEELGGKAGLNEIEAVLLKRQSEIMSKLMEHLVKDQEFFPSGAEG
jgi:hypothetical protein